MSAFDEKVPKTQGRPGLMYWSSAIAANAWVTDPTLVCPGQCKRSNHYRLISFCKSHSTVKHWPIMF